MLCDIVLGYFVPSHFVICYMLLNYFVLSYFVLSYFVLSYFVLSYFVLSCFVLSHFVLSHNVLSYLMPGLFELEVMVYFLQALSETFPKKYYFHIRFFVFLQSVSWISRHNILSLLKYCRPIILLKRMCEF